MTRYALRLAAFLLVIFGACTISTSAQSPPTTADDVMGMQPYQSYHGGDIDSISLTTGMLNVNVPFIAYPTSRVITYTPDSVGRPSEAQDIANGINYATGTCNNGVSSNGACYAPQGALGLIENGANIVTTFLYNDRLQPCWAYAISGAPPTPLPWNTTSTNCTSTVATASVLDLKYNFNLGTDNGNVTGITNDRVADRSQNFTYDQLNRITTAETTSTYATDPTNCWGEAYVYDLVGGPAA